MSCEGGTPHGVQSSGCCEGPTTSLGLRNNPGLHRDTRLDEFREEMEDLRRRVVEQRVRSTRAASPRGERSGMEGGMHETSSSKGPDLSD
eukprot:3163383-Amphidinium_carterae.1